MDGSPDDEHEHKKDTIQSSKGKEEISERMRSHNQFDSNQMIIDCHQDHDLVNDNNFEPLGVDRFMKRSINSTG